MIRLGRLLKVKHSTEESLANHLGIVPEIVFDWECGRSTLGEDYAKAICEHFNAPLGYLLGYRYEIRIPVSKWEKDLQDDYWNAGAELREYMECIHGDPIYDEKKNESADEGELEHAVFEYRKERIDLDLTRDEVEHLANYIKCFKIRPQD